MESNLPPPDDEYIMAAADAVLASTLALLTGHAQCACAQQRMMMARKIRSNLYLLAQHPALPPPFRLVVQRLHGHWNGIVAQSDAGAGGVSPALGIELPESRLWHAAPESVH
ncbi:MAG: hypothetical protein C0451_14275 [Comamonadaceae bacterium]|nr:hypothetical protein [Comamonadaceae bacterium]